MSYLSGQNVLLGVTASIAAYKSAHIVRELIKEGQMLKSFKHLLLKNLLPFNTFHTFQKSCFN